jgi:hypothetical protein
MNIIFLLLVIPAFAINDLVPVYRNRQMKVFWTYAAIMALFVFAAVLISLNIDIPSPVVPINKMVTFIFGVHAE